MDQELVDLAIDLAMKIGRLRGLLNDLDNLGDPDRLALKTSDVRRIIDGADQ